MASDVALKYHQSAAAVVAAASFAVDPSAVKASVAAHQSWAKYLLINDTQELLH